MSALLTSRNADLKQLVDDGYEVAVNGGHLVLNNVPYVNAQRQVRRGKLVSTLTLSGDVTTKPDNHVAFFVGDCPCDSQGNPLVKIVNSSGARDLGFGPLLTHVLSSKPAQGYPNYHEKMSAYIALIADHASEIDPNATARTFSVVESTEDNSPFCYIDTASSRAGVVDVTAKLQGHKIGIVGLGGTGSYILDFVAKTPVKEIHIFDDDVFLQHNGFRAPGAATIDDLRAREPKVVRYHRIYSQLKRGIVPHCLRVNASNADLLRDMDFVFLSLDAGADKAAIIGALEDFGVPFVDVGMGIDVVDGSLLGIVRVTTSTPGMRDHVRAKDRIPMTGDGMENMYERNIQIGELNAFNASLAVIRWKKHAGYYKDLEREHFTAYTIDGNHLLNEDAA